MKTLPVLEQLNGVECHRLTTSDRVTAEGMFWISHPRAHRRELRVVAQHIVFLQIEIGGHE